MEPMLPPRPPRLFMPPLPPPPPPIEPPLPPPLRPPMPQPLLRPALWRQEERLSRTSQQVQVLKTPRRPRMTEHRTPAPVRLGALAPPPSTCAVPAVAGDCPISTAATDKRMQTRRTIASSGSRLGSTPNSKLAPAAPEPDASPMASSGMPRSPARMGEERTVSARLCGPGPTAMYRLRAASVSEMRRGGGR